MKMLMMKMIIMISSIIPFVKNPMPMGMLLFFHTLYCIIYMNYVSLNSWFPMITFLMMIGGLLILIMYMNSIASNEKFKMNINFSIMLIFMIIVFDEFISEMYIEENNNLIHNSTLSLSLIKIFNKKSLYITILLVLYLLMTMISVSNIVKLHQGPLRKFNYE